MDDYQVRSLLADSTQSIPVRETLDLPFVSLAGEHIPVLTPVEVEGRLAGIGGGMVRFDGTAKTTVEMHCARCNTRVEQPLVVEISQRFAKEGNTDDRNNSEELSLDEIDAEPIENDRVDLESVILYEIQLNIPMRVLCREDCKGLCPVCGTNLNEGSCSCDTSDPDPRWDALRALLDE